MNSDGVSSLVHRENAVVTGVNVKHSYHNMDPECHEDGGILKSAVTEVEPWKALGGARESECFSQLERAHMIGRIVCTLTIFC